MLKRKVLRILSTILVFSIFSVTTSAATPHQSISSDSSLKIDNLKLENLPDYLLENSQIDINNTTALDSNDAFNLSSFTTINKDGTKTLHSYDVPIKYINETTNQVEFINNDIEEVNVLDSLFSGYAYENSGNDFSLSLSKNIDNGIQTEYNGDDIQMIPLTKENVTASKRTFEFMGETQTVVEYANAFGDGIHLQYAPVNTGLKENILIEEYNGTNEFQFQIDANGLTVKSCENGSIQFCDSQTDDPVFEISTPWAKDSFYGENIENNCHIALDNYYSIKQNEDGTYLLTMTIDKEFLESPSTVYPVLVDPIVERIVRHNIQDTSVFSSNTQNWHDSDWITVGYLSGKGTGMSYVKTTVMPNIMFINPNKITEAKFHVWERSGNSNTSSILLYDTVVTSPVGTVNYSMISNGCNGSSISSVTCTSSNTKYSFDITKLVKAWMKHELKDGGFTQDYGFILKAENANSTYKQFASSNNSSTAYQHIDITYNVDTSLASGIYFIKGKESGKYVDVQAGSSSSGANVQLYKFNGTNAQQWKVTNVGDGYYELSPLTNTDLRLDVSGGKDETNKNIQVYNNNGTDAQKWRILKNADGTYRLIPKISSFRGMDVQGGGSEDKTNIALYDYWGTDNQRWYFEKCITDYINTTQTICSWVVPVDGLVITVNYPVSLNGFVTVEQSDVSSRYVRETSAFTRIQRSTLIAGIQEPDLSISKIQIDGSSISTSFNNNVLLGDWIYDARIGYPDKKVGTTATFYSLASCMIKNAVFPYQSAACEFNF